MRIAVVFVVVLAGCSGQLGLDAGGGDVAASPDGGGGCAPLSLCPGIGCVDQMNDPMNCGGCGATCASGASCVHGTCAGRDAGADATADVVDAAVDAGADVASVEAGDADDSPPDVTCGFGETYCPGTGCTHLSTDANNCGACGNVCPDLGYPNTMPACGGYVPGGMPGAGVCGFWCVGPYRICGVPPSNAGCLTNTSIDAANCGACGFHCAAGYHCTPTATPGGMAGMCS